VQVPRALQDQALRELADAVAQQARRLLRVLAGRWRGEPESGVWQALEPLLGAPLFATPEEGQAALKEVLASASAVRAKA
jgi:hypothetical protein